MFLLILCNFVTYWIDLIENCNLALFTTNSTFSPTCVDNGAFNVYVRGGADKSLARPGRKQATATKLAIYSTYSRRSSIHFLAHCSDFCKQLKKNSEGCPSNQVSAAAMTSASDEKHRSFNCFFSPGNRW